MDPSFVNLMMEIAKQGIGIMVAGVFFFLFYRERNENKDLTTKLFDLGMKAVEAELKTQTAISQSSDLIKNTLQLLTGRQQT